MNGEAHVKMFEHVPDGTDTVEYLVISTAAARLHTTPEAVRKRIRRGTLAAIKRDGRWLIVLDAARPAATLDVARDDGPDSRTVSVQSALVASLEDQVTWLRAELERRDATIAALVEREPRITAPEASEHAPQRRSWWRWWRNGA